MNWVSFGIACVKLLSQFTTWLEQRKWYRDGEVAGIAEDQADEKAAQVALQKRYDEIAAAPLGVDDAVARLRSRAAGSQPATPQGDGHLPIIGGGAR